jgi:thioredoxin 1
MSSREIITHIENRQQLFDLIANKENILVLKFGAEWCGPCKKIEGLVNEWYNILPANVICGILDVDENFDVFAFYKQKRIVKTIPTILRYDADHNHWAPSDFISSSDSNDINTFFKSIVDDA